MANEYPAKIAKRTNVWTYELIYRLDPTKPYVVKYADDGKWYNQKDVATLLATVRTHGIHEDALKLLCENDFITWLTLRPNQSDGRRGALLEQLVKQLGTSAPNNGWFLLYSIFPEMGINGVTDSKSADFIGTAPQIGQAINRALNNEPNPGRITFLSDLKTGSFSGSRLDQYLRARKMSAYADGIKKIIDINANINAHKSAPYNDIIARFKVVDYLGARPGVKIGSKWVYDLDGIKRLTLTERKNNSITLSALASLFFQERKGGSFSFSVLKSYYDFLEAYIPNAYSMDSSASERQRVTDIIDNRNRAWASLRRTRVLTMVLCLIPMVAVLAWMLYISFTTGASTLENAFNAVGNVVAVILAVIGALAGLAGGIIGAVLGGLAGYWIPKWLFGLLASIAPFIVAVFVIGLAITLIVIMMNVSSDKLIPSKSRYDSLYDQAMLYLVCSGLGTSTRVFGSSSADPSDIFRQSADQARSQRSSVTKAAIGMVVLAAATLGLGILINNSIDKEEKIEQSAIFYPPSSKLAGQYTGTFHGREATMNLTMDNFYANGQVVIQYTTPMTQHVSGEYSASDGKLEMTVDGTNKTYNATVTSDGSTITISGEYYNPSQGTRHTFEFYK